MKLYYTEKEPQEILKNFFTKTAKFEVKEKKKLNYHLLLDTSSTLIILYNAKTKKLTAKIAGYRDKKLKLNLPENSYLHLLKFKPEVFYILMNGQIEKYKNKLINFPDIKFVDSKIPDSEILKIITKYFEQKKIEINSVKKYVVQAIKEIFLKNGIYKFDENKYQVSLRQFQREFKKVTGFSPKEFSSIVRINSLTSALVKENVSLRDIFFDFGFYDQAHFNKEFKKVTGANPSLFESRQKLIMYLNLMN